MTPATWKNAADGLTGYNAHNARALAALHPRINDWVAAAPVLAALPLLPPVRAALKQMAAGGWRCKSVLASLGIPTCLRKLSAADVELLGTKRIAILIECPAESIAAHAGKANKLASAIDEACVFFDGKPEAVIWLLSYDWPTEAEFGQIKDYFNQHGERWDWSPRRVVKEHEAWVKSMRTEKARAVALRPEHQAPVNIGENPDEIGVEGVTCTAICTTGGLILEGAAMAHCVGGDRFQQQLKNGTAMFYHMANADGESTVMLVRRGEKTAVHQHNAEHNKPPPDSHKKAAELLCAEVTVLRGNRLLESGAELQQALMEQQYRALINRYQDRANNPLGQQAYGGLGRYAFFPNRLLGPGGA